MTELETLATLPSRKTKGKTYTVKRNPQTGVISCDCPGWIYSKRDPRSCRHTLVFEAMLSKEPINPGAFIQAGQQQTSDLTMAEVDARNVRDFGSNRPDFAWEGEATPKGVAELLTTNPEAILRDQLRRSLSQSQRLEILATWEALDNPDVSAQITAIGRARRRLRAEDGTRSRQYVTEVSYLLSGGDNPLSLPLVVDEENFRKNFTPKIVETGAEKRARQTAERLARNAATAAKKPPTKSAPKTESTVSLLTVRTITFDED